MALAELELCAPVAGEHSSGEVIEAAAAASNVVVHLKPAPVVARVMTETAVLHADAEQWLAREVAVAAFVAERCELVVPPILPRVVLLEAALTR